MFRDSAFAGRGAGPRELGGGAPALESSWLGVVFNPLGLLIECNFVLMDAGSRFLAVFGENGAGFPLTLVDLGEPLDRFGL